MALWPEIKTGKQKDWGDLGLHLLPWGADNPVSLSCLPVRLSVCRAPQQLL